MLKKLLILNSVLLLLISCNSINKDSNTFSPHKSISFEQNNIDTVPFSEMIQGLKSIKLESSNHSMFGKIDKLIIDNGLVYILDKSNTKSVLIFNTKGKCINIIRKPGKGPGEYLSIFDMAVYDNYIFLVDNFGKKVLQYDTTGNHINTIKLKKGYPLNIHANKKGLYVYNYLLNNKVKNEVYRINYYIFGKKDMNKLTLKSSFSVNSSKAKFNLKLSEVFRENHNKDILFFKPMVPKIYKITQDGIKLFLNFNIDQEIPSNINNMKQLIETNIPVFIGEYYPINKRLAYFRYITGRKNNSMFISNNNLIIIDPSISYRPNLSPSEMLFLFSNPLCTSNNVLWTSIEKYKVKQIIPLIHRYFDKKQLQKAIPGINQIIKQIENTNEMDNPILVGWKFKS